MSNFDYWGEMFATYLSAPIIAWCNPEMTHQWYSYVVYPQE